MYLCVCASVRASVCSSAPASTSTCVIISMSHCDCLFGIVRTDLCEHVCICEQVRIHVYV